jgi:hypothetical protein
LLTRDKHFARNPGTKDDETPAELKLKEKIHAKIHDLVMTLKISSLGNLTVVAGVI